MPTPANPSCLDSHVWLSPRQSKIQARLIASTLMQLYPENREIYKACLQQLLAVDLLDR